MVFMDICIYQPIFNFPEHGDHKSRSSRSAERSKIPAGTCGPSWEPTECLSWEVAKTEFECTYGDWRKSLKLPYIDVLKNVAFFWIHYHLKTTVRDIVVTTSLTIWGKKYLKFWQTFSLLKFCSILIVVFELLFIEFLTSLSLLNIQKLFWKRVKQIIE